MRPIVWKFSTFTAMGIAVFFAVHPLSSQPQTAAEKKAAAQHKSSGILGALFGGGGNSDTSPHTGAHVDALANARNAEETCEAIRELAPEASGDEQAVAAITERTDVGHPRAVRLCALRALEQITSGSAKSYLGELVADQDSTIRNEAIRILALKARDDAEARSTILGLAQAGDKEQRLEALLALGDAHMPEASGLIQKALTQESGETQARLIAALGETRDAAAVPVLAQLLDGTSRPTRTAALQALGAIGGTAAVTALKSTLASGSREDVGAAAQALARVGDETSKKALLDALESSTSRTTQVAVMHALVQVDGPDVRTAMQKAMRGTDSQSVIAASSWFAAHPEGAAVSELTAALKSAPPDARGAIVSALSGIHSDDAQNAVVAIARKPGPEQMSALSNLMALPGGRDEGRRISIQILKEGGQNTSMALSLLGQDGTPEARDALISTARGGGNVANQAMRALAQHGDPQAMRALGEIAQTGKTPAVRAQALAALSDAGDPKTKPTFLAAIHDKDPGIRRTALIGLARVGGPDAERALVDATGDADESTRTAAIRALGRIETPSAVSQLEHLAGNGGDTATTAYQTLVGVAPEKAAAMADRVMSSSDTEMRQTVIQNATSLPGDTGKRLLQNALRDTDASIVVSAIDGLSNLGGPDAQSTILGVLQSTDSSAAAKRAAANALHSMGGAVATDNQNLIEKYMTDSEGDDAVESDED